TASPSPASSKTAPRNGNGSISLPTSRSRGSPTSGWSSSAGGTRGPRSREAGWAYGRGRTSRTPTQPHRPGADRLPLPADELELDLLEAADQETPEPRTGEGGEVREEVDHGAHGGRAVVDRGREDVLLHVRLGEPAQPHPPELELDAEEAGLE